MAPELGGKRLFTHLTAFNSFVLLYEANITAINDDTDYFLCVAFACYDTKNLHEKQLNS